LDDSDDADVEKLSLEVDELSLDDTPKKDETQKAPQDAPRTYDGSVQDRLDTVEEFYVSSSDFTKILGIDVFSEMDFLISNQLSWSLSEPYYLI
jgi:hypothetical protein